MNETAKIVISSAECREAWVRRIHGVWQQSVEAIIETGRLLMAAKAALAHGEFLQMARHVEGAGVMTRRRPR